MIPDFNECPIGRQVETSLAVIQSQQEDIHSAVRGIEKALAGNGREGLVVSVAKLSVRVKILFGIISALGMGLIALGGKLLLP